MKVWGVVAACVLVAGCSSATGAQRAPELHSAAAVGKAIGCETPLKKDDSIAQEEKICLVKQVPVSIIRTANRDVAKMYVDMGSGFGSSYAAVNQHWLIASSSRPLIHRLAKAHGWKLY